jgi:uncharacterized protein (TIGR00269 family)
MRCECGKPAVYFRKHEGTYLCREHFLSSVERKVKKNIRVNGLLESNDRIAIAVSGGKDSMALLSIMHSIVSPRRDMKMVAISVDEGIRGYRARSISMARRFCKARGIQHHVFSFKAELGRTTDDMKREIAAGKRDPEVLCTFCGVGRRYVLNRKARELRCSKLCLGHNLDDEVQSILMNWLRGDLGRASRMGPGPAAFDEKFVPRIKPLRPIPEKEVMLYAILKGLDFHGKECPNRSGLRNEIREFVQTMESKHSGMKFSVLDGFDRLVPSIREVVAKGDIRVRYCAECGEPTSRKVCKTCLLWKGPIYGKNRKTTNTKRDDTHLE